MAALLVRLDRLHGALARRLVPGIVRGLDRRLLRRRPLLWRSRLLPALCLALPLAVLAAAAGLAVPMRAETVWTSLQVDTAVALLQWPSLIAVLFWARLQLRYPLGEARVAVHLAIVFYNLLAVSALLLPAQALNSALGQRVAGVMTPAEFQRHLDYFERNDFLCGGTLTDNPAKPPVRLLESLGAFGLTTQGMQRYEDDNEVPAYCDQDDGWIEARYVVTDLAGRPRPTLLYDRLVSIQRRQHVEAGPLGALPTRIGQGLERQVAVIVAVLLTLTVLSVPRHVWRRRLVAVDPASHRRRIAVRLWLPGWLRRLDRRLLLYRPLFWATRAHVFMFHALTLGALATGAFFVLIEVLFDDALLDVIEAWVDNQLAAILVFGVVVGSSAILWAVTCRRRYIPAVNPGQWRRMVGSFYLATLPLPFLFNLIGQALGLAAIGDNSSGWEIYAISTVFSLLAVSPVVAATLTANYIGWLHAGLGVALGVPLLMAPMALAEAGIDEQNVIAVCVVVAVAWLLCALWLVPSCCGGRRGKATAMRPRIVALVMAAAPAACLLVFLGVITLAEKAGAPDWGGAILSLAAYALATVAVFGWMLLPSLRALTRARFAPAAD